MELSVDGRKAYAYTGGKPFDPALPCVVFIHGALHDHSVLDPAGALVRAPRLDVLAVDLPGHGRSAGPPLASVEALADWTLALLDAAGVRAGRAGRPQHGLADRAGGRGARAASASAAWCWSAPPTR